MVTVWLLATSVLLGAGPGPIQGPFPGTATCAACPRPPCTRPCLPSLGAGGPAAPRAYSRGACPALAAGWNRDFGYDHRDFLLRVPASTHGPFAVVFFWPANGSADTIAPIFSDKHDAGGYILVIPSADSRFPLTWSMDANGADDDLRFFDDVLTCLDQQFPIDRRRIHSSGYSTGACFSAYLAGHRSDVLASFASFSGGGRTPSGQRLGPMPAHPIPGLLYHGGDSDSLWAGKEATLALAREMAGNGQFTVVCDHGRGHVVGASVDEMWSFLLAQPFSPGNAAAWAKTGLSGKLPPSCSVVR